MCYLISSNKKHVQNCACGNLRKATRTITQFYDKMLQQTGLRSTQCLLLLDISLNKNISVSNLANILLMDQSTVTRNIELLRKSGFIDIKKEGLDSRKKCIFITDKGLKKLEESKPILNKAQNKIENGIGKARIEELLKILTDIEKLVE
ncbi:MarR family winged helix-turn-helix transcriptional regulator [Clostridium psychrophilum]|uniref:MarR family winged helix-turn-helix transcriptional regulator n=1 Tax=Clostridium psychrophilum TaxID=132926 RepID=UPI001C0B7E83|nr:MarR family winged helix-turn-helix transcriptional regulator [Clostridium psychrophilum]MBU3181723.1 MarR family winged helix-turn-helix transcriptional regulator [Clostridium psychrophilum]